MGRLERGKEKLSCDNATRGPASGSGEVGRRHEFEGQSIA